MGGASANHAPAVTPIITEDSNPLSDRGRHVPFPPLQAQVTITRDHDDEETERERSYQG